MVWAIVPGATTHGSSQTFRARRPRSAMRRASSASSGVLDAGVFPITDDMDPPGTLVVESPRIGGRHPPRSGTRADAPDRLSESHHIEPFTLPPMTAVNIPPIAFFTRGARAAHEDAQPGGRHPGRRSLLTTGASARPTRAGRHTGNARLRRMTQDAAEAQGGSLRVRGDQSPARRGYNLTAGLSIRCAPL